MKICALCALAALTAAGGWIRNPDPSMGVTTLPPERNRWRSRFVQPVQAPQAADFRAVERDFFELEYGRKEAFDFAVPTNGAFAKTYGAKAFDDAACGARVGRGWGDLMENRARFEIDVEQNADETDWRVVFHAREWDANGRSFKLKRGRNVVPLGVISRQYANVYGLEFTCKTPGAKGRVKALRFVPEELPMEWRLRFVAPARPVKAGISYDERPNYVLTANGCKVREGNRLLFARVRKQALTDFLQPGTNEIAFAGNWGGGYGGFSPFAVEAFVVDAEGRTTVLDNGAWECRTCTGGGAWTKCRLGGKIGLETLSSGKPFANGSLPLHAGPLTVAPKNPDGSVYPVFDCDGPITWTAQVPPGVRCDEITAEVAGRAYRVENGVVDFAGLGTGAYEIFWTARRDGKTLDADRTEMIVAGPLPDVDAVPFAAFEGELAKRKKLLQAVDCTEDVRDPTNFVDHTGPYAAPRTGVSRVVSEGGLRFRETGSGNGDFFGYKLKTGARGNMHLVEIDVPDVREQIVYAAVNESIPVPFCNNGGWPTGTRGWPNATGAAKSGGVMPLSGKMKTVTLVFFPGTDNATLAFGNGLPGKRAGVAGFRVYEIPRPPALALPPTQRLYANHDERIFFNNWGVHVNPKIQEYCRDVFDGCWQAGFAAVANRIRYLKFAGHNAALEGCYMYNEGFPSESGESDSCAEEWDLYYAMAKMYRHNGIRLLACFEYMHSPALDVKGLTDVSDGEIHAGKKRSVFSVDRHGRQVTGYMGSGLNYLNPDVAASVKRVVGACYRRYARTKAVEALWVVSGYWWMPGIPMLQRETAADVGYDDDSIEQFQRDEGVDLGLPWTGRERFPARYAALNGKYKDRWYGWRAKRLRRALEEIKDVVSSGDAKWDVFVMPTGNYPVDHPFCRTGATQAERDGFLADHFRKIGFDPGLYGKGTDAAIGFVANAKYERALDADNYGILVNRGSRALYRKNDALYFHPVGLNERPCRCPAATWWWNDNGIAVYDVKQTGENAFCDLVDVVADYAPKRIFHTWLDVNVTTAFTEEARRFLAGFYATPCCEPVAFAGVGGVTAKRYGERAVQLVNATPYVVRGELDAQAPAEDALTGRRFAGKIAYEMKPFGVTVVTVDDPERNLTGRFAFDAAVVARARERARAVLGHRRILARLPSETRGALTKGLAAGDDYALVVALRERETVAAIGGFFEEVPPPATPAKETLAWNGGDSPCKIGLGGGHRFKGAQADGKSAIGEITLSLLIEGEGTQGVLMFGFDGMRFDYGVENGKARPAIVGFPPGKTFFALELPRQRNAGTGRHHVVYRVNPKGEASIWVDAEKVAACDFAAKWGGGALPRRTHGDVRVNFWDNGRFSKDCSFAIRRVALYDGLLTQAEISAQADAWQTPFGR